MSFFRKFFANKQSSVKTDYLRLIATISKTTLASLCPKVDFEAGALQLSELPRALKCNGCGKLFSLPDKAFLVRKTFLGGQVGFLEDANFGFRVNAVGSVDPAAKTLAPTLLTLTCCGVTSITRDLRHGKETAWGCIECQHDGNLFPTEWAKTDSTIDDAKELVAASTGANDLVNRALHKGFALIDKKDGPVVAHVLGRNNFVLLLQVVPRLGADKIHTLTVGERGRQGFQLIKDFERQF